MATTLEKSLPHDLAAERALLGSILLDPGALKVIESEIERNDFFSDGHRLVYNAILNLAARNEPADIVTIASELKHTGTLEKAGGVAYIAGLSDGIPMGDYSFVASYARIIKKKSKARAFINMNANLMSRAFDDADIDELTSEARGQLEVLAPVSSNGHGKEASAAQPPEHFRGDCPEIPKAAYHSMALRYYELIQPTTMASHNFHLPAFLTLVGNTLGPKGSSTRGGIFLVDSEPVWPIFYTVLVGEAGAAKKGTAMKKAIRLANSYRSDIYVIHSLDSAERFIRNLQTVQGAGQEFRPALFYMEEFRSMLAKAMREGAGNITSELCKAYDRATLEVNAGVPAKVFEPFVSFLAATSTKYMKGLSDTDIEGGLGSRTMFVPGARQERIAKPPRVELKGYHELIDELERVQRYWQEEDKTGRGTEFKLSRGADDVWVPFFETTLGKAGGDDQQMDALIQRMDHHCLKTAMIYAALDFTSEIELKHLEPAIAFTEFLIKGAFYIFSEHGVPPWVETERRIVDYVEKRMPRGIQRRPLQQHFWKIGAEEFNRRMKGLVGPDSELSEVQRGRQKWVLVNA